MRSFTIIIALFIGMTMVLDASGQSLPRHVELIVPGMSGGHLDRLGRIVADGLNKSTSQKVMVRTYPSGGILAAGGVGSFHKTDGSQLAIMSNLSYLTFSALPKRRKPTPIAMVGLLEFGLFVSQSNKVNILADFRTKPRKKIVVGAMNSVSKLAALKTFGKLGVAFKFADRSSTINCNRNPQSCALDAIIRPARAYPGFKGIAVFSNLAHKIQGSRLIKTATEQGVPVQASIAYGIVGPSGMSVSTTKRISRDLEKLLRRKDFQKRFKGFGVRPEFRDGKSYRRQFEQHLVRTDYCKLCNCKVSKRCRRVCSQCK